MKQQTNSKLKNVFQVLSSLCVCLSMGVLSGMPVSAVELDKNITQLTPETDHTDKAA
ncbi:MAG: hypothetical protein IJ598_01410 [Ruminococcus sp.]|nr:hypothetical protein [Ruminococcus sp.]